MNQLFIFFKKQFLLIFNENKISIFLFFILVFLYHFFKLIIFYFLYCRRKIIKAWFCFLLKFAFHIMVEIILINIIKKTYFFQNKKEKY